MSVKWKNIVFLFWSVMLLSTVSPNQDCGDGYLTINIKGGCTSSSCIGECRDESTCCLERCFAGNQPTDQEFEGCVIDPDVVGTCSNFANQTECLARNVNKTFAVCWEHSVYFISSHPYAASIKGFNPVNCPCENGHTRTAGPCSFPQCANSSLCESKEDPVLNVDVCCLDTAILPQGGHRMDQRTRKYNSTESRVRGDFLPPRQETDCDSDEELDRSVHQYLNASTLAQCQGMCQGGPCKMPNAGRLPACCKRLPKIAESPDDVGLHGSVIAVVVTIIFILILVGAFGLFYYYRIKQEENQFKRKREGDTTSIEVTGVNEMLGGEQAWTEDGATHLDIVATRNGNLTGGVPGDNNQVPDSYQVPDKYDIVSPMDFNLSVNSIDRLRNGNAQAYDNQTFIDDDDIKTDIKTDDEQCSFQPYRIRTGSTDSIEFELEGDNVHFDNENLNSLDGQDHGD